MEIHYPNLTRSDVYHQGRQSTQLLSVDRPHCCLLVPPPMPKLDNILFLLLYAVDLPRYSEK